MRFVYPHVFIKKACSMRNQRSFHDPLDYKLVIQPGSEEYKAYIRSLRRAANESKRVNRFLHDENIVCLIIV